MENQAIQDDLRSHVSHFSAMAAKGGKSRFDEFPWAFNLTNNFKIVLGLSLTVNPITVSQIIHNVAT